MNKGTCPNCGRHLLETPAPPGTLIVLPQCPGCKKGARVVVRDEAPRSRIDKRAAPVLR
jgi:hypothetical protein